MVALQVLTPIATAAVLGWAFGLGLGIAFECEKGRGTR